MIPLNLKLNVAIGGCCSWIGDFWRARLLGSWLLFFLVPPCRLGVWSCSLTVPRPTELIASQIVSRIYYSTGMSVYLGAKK